MLKYLFLVLKGILFGASNLIPGGSGGTTLVVCGIYEDTLNSITTLKSNFKKSFIFLLFLLIGTVIGVISGSLLIKKVLLVSIPFMTYCMFAGFIIGTLPNLISPYIKKIKVQYVIGFIISLAAVIGLLFLGFKINNNTINFGDKLQFKDYALLFLCGFIGIFAMIVPGVSGILIFLIFGYYGIFLDAINNIYHIHSFVDAFLVCLPVGLGMVAGIIPASILMKFLMKKFPTGTYFCIFGFVIGSVICLFLSYFHEYNNPKTLHLILGIIELIIFAVISFVISSLADKKKNNIKPKENIDNDIKDEISKEEIE
jgi:putative membrane protein